VNVTGVGETAEIAAENCHAALEAELSFREERYGNPFEGLKPAPPHIKKLVEQFWTSPSDKTEVEVTLTLSPSGAVSASEGVLVDPLDKEEMSPNYDFRVYRAETLVA